MEFVGKVVSNKMQKTAVVEIERLISHPVYKKRIRQRTRVKAHDELGVKQGDSVKIVTTRPLSKDKHFKITQIVKEGASGRDTE
jgi:small subunit ribosomal protein S17